MHFFGHLHLLLAIYHLTNTLKFSQPSSLSIAAQTSPLNLTSSYLLPTVGVQCDPPDTAPSLNEDGCISALERLPSNSVHVRFHGDGESGVNKLPVSVSHAHCGVSIDLIDHVTEEQSSWDEVYGAGARIVIECTETQDGLGGNTLVGNNLLIRVTIRYVDEAAGRSNNSTILSN